MRGVVASGASEPAAQGGLSCTGSQWVPVALPSLFAPVLSACFFWMRSISSSMKSLMERSHDGAVDASAG